MRDAAARGVAVVTGGTAGIGRATVRRLAQHGWDVGIIAREQDRLDAAAAEVRTFGRRSFTVSADVADAALVDAAADAIESALGPIDVWVNNAFTGSIAFFDQVEPAEFERVTAVTYFGYVNGTRAALRRMEPRGHGTIIQVGSALAFRGIPLQSAYCGAKHAIVGFTESVRTELLHKGLDVQLCEVHMPAVNTPQFGWVLHRGVRHHPQPVPPIYQPEVAARAIVGMARRPRRSMLVGLPTVLTVLANRVAPALLDRYLAHGNVGAQQSPAHDPAGATSNTWQPVGGSEIAAHGVFDATAYAHSPALWVSQRRARVTGALLIAGISAAAAAVVRSTKTKTKVKP